MDDKRIRVIAVAVLIGAFVPITVPAAKDEAELSYAYKPPVVSFPPDGVDLLEAVRLTLAHAPDIQLQVAAAEFQQGVAQESHGPFDATIAADVSVEYREQELTESRKAQLQEERDTLDQVIVEGQQEIAQTDALLESIDQAQADPDNATLPDQELQLQLEVLNALIAQADDPTPFVEARNEFLTIQEDKALASRAQAEDAVAKAQKRRTDIGSTPEEEYFGEANIVVQGSNLFRNGIVFSQFLDGQGLSENYKGKPTSAEYGGKGVEDLFIFRAGVGAVFPLLRGRGRDATGAFETAAGMDHTAQLQLVKHQSSLSVLATVLAYWDARAAQELVAVAEHSVELQRRLEELTGSLIESGDMAATEIARVRASRSSAEARLDESERRLHQARVDLALAMGIAVTDDADSLPQSRDGFPPLAEGPLDDAALSEEVANALNRRQDLAAARTTLDSGKVLVRGAETDTRSRLDLETTAWMTALGESSVSNAVDRWVGPSGRIALVFERPIGNNFFEGRLAQREADTVRRDIDLVDLERQIRLEIVRAARSTEIVARRVRQADAAVGFYRTTIDAEIEKLQEGESSLIDTILTEEQQTGALTEQILARQEYARLVAQLRFEVGSLVAHEEETSAVTKEALVTPPWIATDAGAGP